MHTFSLSPTQLAQFDSTIMATLNSIGSFATRCTLMCNDVYV